MAEVCIWAQIWAKTELDDNLLENIFIRPVKNLQDAVTEALRLKGSNAKVLVFPDGGITVPLIQR